MQEIKDFYKTKKQKIISKLNMFKTLPIENYIKELFFCILTPQSNAKKCWQAIEELKQLDNPTKKQITDILKSKTRFHNNKADYILKAKANWQNILSSINTLETLRLRNWLADNVKGLGMKESSHFLRNIGESNNQIAILDRHILRNLKQLSLIKEEKIKSKNHYLKTENTFLALADYLSIPADHLDLLFWAKETGEVFK
jgi:N-glycosylase/DNA lyase